IIEVGAYPIAVGGISRDSQASVVDVRYTREILNGVADDVRLGAHPGRVEPRTLGGPYLAIIRLRVQPHADVGDHGISVLDESAVERPLIDDRVRVVGESSHPLAILVHVGARG